MKKTLCLIGFAFLLLSSKAQDFTYSTNLFYADTATTNIFQGTNSTDPGRDTFHIIWCKVNANTRILDERSKSNTLALISLRTNPPTAFSNVVSAPFFKISPYTVTNSTDSTFGLGTGLITADINYVYVSVGSNTWKRAALSTW